MQLLLLLHQLGEELCCAVLIPPGSGSEDFMCLLQCGDHCLLRCDCVEGLDLLNAGDGLAHLEFGFALAQGGLGGAEALVCVGVGRFRPGRLQQREEVGILRSHRRLQAMQAPGIRLGRFAVEDHLAAPQSGLFLEPSLGFNQDTELLEDLVLGQSGGALLEDLAHLLEDLLDGDVRLPDVRRGADDVFASAAQVGCGRGDAARGEGQQLLVYCGGGFAVLLLIELVGLQVAQQPINPTRGAGNQAPSLTLALFLGSQLVAHAQHVGRFGFSEDLEGE